LILVSEAHRVIRCEDVHVRLASLRPRNLRLTGEIADGWLATFLAPEFASESLPHLAAGPATSGLTMADFDVVSIVPMTLGDDIQACADRLRPRTALYLGGMGSQKYNFYNDIAVLMGYGAAARDVQDRYLAGDRSAAAAAVPSEFIDRTSLLGSVGRIAERMAAYAAAGVTTLTITPHAADFYGRVYLLEQALEALERSGAADGAATQAHNAP
jgi:alkanesulfonate monooxygenase SsuD/methylene tetrahydromethanopterin reductase-like flavin-dependent oxidoreductase (luciferase family)